jgi:hypothetical protein
VSAPHGIRRFVPGLIALGSSARVSRKLPVAADPGRVSQRHRHQHHHRPAGKAVRRSAEPRGAAALAELHAELAGRQIGMAIAGEHGQLSDMLSRSLLRDQIGAHLCVVVAQLTEPSQA